MADVSVRVDGFPEVERLLKQTGHKLTDAIKGAVAETALNVERNAKQATPVDTGRLRSSIGVSFDGNRLGADVATNVEYAPHVEFGTVKQEAQPFMTPAREAAVRDFPDTVAKHARRVIG